MKKKCKKLQKNGRGTYRPHQHRGERKKQLATAPAAPVILEVDPAEFVNGAPERYAGMSARRLKALFGGPVTFVAKEKRQGKHHDGHE